jgi:hypothetical protein
MGAGSQVAAALSTPSTATAAQTGGGVQLSASPTSLSVNQPVTLTATVSGEASGAPPSGSITVQNHGAAIPACTGVTVAPSGADGSAACTTSFGAPSASLTAVFTPAAGSDLHSSASPVLTLAVAPNPTSIALRVAKAMMAGNRITFTARLSVPTGLSGPLAPSGTIRFSDHGKPIPGCNARRMRKLTATCTITYVLPGRHAITAGYGADPNYSAATSAASSLTVTPIPVTGRITATVRWTFFFTPSYTTVLGLVVSGLYEGTAVNVGCHGQGCPFAAESFPVRRIRLCSPRVPATSCPPNRFNLTAGFDGHKLSPGAHLTILIVHPGYVGKYYGFTVRASQAPLVQIACLAPMSTIPGAACSSR